MNDSDHAPEDDQSPDVDGAGRDVTRLLDRAAGGDELALDEAVCRLEAENPEAGKIVRLRFYAGLTIDETAAAMGLPPRTIDRRWSFAKA